MAGSNVSNPAMTIRIVSVSEFAGLAKTASAPGQAATAAVATATAAATTTSAAAASAAATSTAAASAAATATAATAGFLHHAAKRSGILLIESVERGQTDV
jgi:hypothetical protein